MKQVMISRFECETCGARFPNETVIRKCEKCGNDFCVNCTEDFNANCCEDEVLCDSCARIMRGDPTKNIYSACFRMEFTFYHETELDKDSDKFRETMNKIRTRLEDILERMPLEEANDDGTEIYVHEAEVELIGAVEEDDSEFSPDNWN